MCSLFDGSGGFPLAGVLCGIEPVMASEIEPYPIAVTRSRFPNMIHIGDVSKVNGADITPVDLITFGSPCQDLSVAGKRAGLKHEQNGDEETTRSGLFMEGRFLNFFPINIGQLRQNQPVKLIETILCELSLIRSRVINYICHSFKFLMIGKTDNLLQQKKLTPLHRLDVFCSLCYIIFKTSYNNIHVFQELTIFIKEFLWEDIQK